MFKPSKFQQAIFDHVKIGYDNLIIEAVAGSGKTTTIVQALELIPPTQRVVFLAFNKSIAEELKTRVPKHVSAMTLNGLGHQAWMRFAGKITLNSSKTRDIINNRLADEYEEALLKKMFSGVRRLVGIAKASGIVPAGMEGLYGLVADTDDVWERMIEHFDIQFSEKLPPWKQQQEKTEDEQAKEATDKQIAIEMARKVLKYGIEMKNEIDFDDQLYMTVIHDAPVYQYDWVFVDEAQDVSDIQRALVAKAKKKHGRLCAVGDPSQAIYGFRGADSNSLENIAKMFNCVRLPLSISYRCPKKVVAEAQQIVSHIEASETANEGTVEDLGVLKPEMFQIHDMVICRNTAPLIKLAYTLIGSRIPVRVMGRDLGAGLIALIEKLNAKGIDRLVQKLEEWHSREVKRMTEKDPEADLTAVNDKREVILTFIEMSGAESVPQLITAIENLFSDDDGDCVLLSTIHKAKGMEADRVFILDRHLMPSKYARKPWQQQQEANLEYVAITRSKNYLGYVESPKTRG